MLTHAVIKNPASFHNMIIISYLQKLKVNAFSWWVTKNQMNIYENEKSSVNWPMVKMYGRLAMGFQQ